MTSYAKVKWDIIEKWNSDAKYTNSHLIDIASEMGVEIRNKNADRKSIIAKVSDAVIKSDVEKGDCTITEWGAFSQEQTNFENYMGSLGVPEPELELDIESDTHEHEHEHDDGTVHSHPHEDGHHEDVYMYEDVEQFEHTHEDGPYAGTPHSHEGGDQPHTHATHDEDGVEVHNGDFASLVIPSIEKMTKKALDEWAADNGIILDRRKTKAHMLKELKKRLNA